MEEFDFIGPNDKPALLAISTPECLSVAKSELLKMGYKVHVVDSHLAFDTRYNQVNYQVVILEDSFDGGTILENPTLDLIQSLPMNQRRYATFFLIGPDLESLNSMQAFGHSVHCVLNYTELGMLNQVVKKTIGENDLFLNTFRDVQRRVYQKQA